ncbi:hypothetical protein [Arthrobacter glacialis]|uniref:Uncharacterized protein n=1 Tax=Arthrobacter glacialis TaxID=1664 RepID=A0A2S4A0P8_ARTGL|nr:hypothetical protein [Arthrobacter glacialis]POH74849.1 hypothetical protein CVS27_02985 [Arthrobacter glacialis]
MNALKRGRERNSIASCSNAIRENAANFGNPTWLELVGRKKADAPVLGAGQVCMIGNGQIFHPA